MAKLGNFTHGPFTVSVDGGKTWFTPLDVGFEYTEAVDVSPVAAPKTDAEIVAEVYSLTAAAGLQLSPYAIQAVLYQDDDAHDTCTLTACLNPLHPGPCKGWKGTLHEVAPKAWKALEDARVEKANHTRLKKIEALKQAGKPIPYKLLQPIVAKSHPHEGQTAKMATGEAHAAGKAVAEAAGVHVSAPGKVTLGQAVKAIPQNTGEKGPKGKKPTVASKGIAFVIAQEKVTPQYKLDKAAKITPEEWSGLSHDDKAVIRGELTKIQADGFGPQQKKATELLAKFNESKKEAPKAEPPAVPSFNDKVQQVKGHMAKGSTLSEAVQKVTGKPSGTAVATSLPQYATPLGTQKLLKQHGSLDITVNKGVEGHEATFKDVGLTGDHEHFLTHESGGHWYITDKNGKQLKHVSKQEGLSLSPGEKPKTEVVPPSGAKPSLNDMVAKVKDEITKGASFGEAVGKVTGLPVVTEPAKIENKAEKPKELPKHVQNAIDMANGHAPGASWSKNHLAAYQPLSAEEFHGLPKDTQDKIVQELHKGKTKFLDPKKIAAAQALIDKFGAGKSATKAPTAPKVEDVSFLKDLHNHAVTDKQAKEAAAGTAIGVHFNVAKQIAGLTPTDSPDSPGWAVHSATAAKVLLENKTKLYSPKVLGQPKVKAAAAEFEKATTESLYAHAVAEAKKSAFNKIHLKLANDHGELSPIEKASLHAYQQHILSHSEPPTHTDHLDELKAKAAKASMALDAELHDALKIANAPKPEAMSPAQVASRAAELMGPEAVNPKIDLTLGEMKEAHKLGVVQADEEIKAGKYSAEALNNPAAMSAWKGLAHAFKQLNATKMNQAKLDNHFNEHHLAVKTAGHDIHGNTLTAEDHKIIELHADQIEAKHNYLDAVQAVQEKMVATSKAHFHATLKAAQANVTPPEPVKLSDYDQATIHDAYANAWTKHASKAVLYGVQSYDQKSKMKAHPQYASLTMDLGDLKKLSGDLALAHAQVNTTAQNVPTDPETGHMLAGPEKQAWAAAKSHLADVQADFTKLHKVAQARLDHIRVDAGLKKRALPKADAPAVKATAAESGFYKTASYSGPNYGKSASAKGYMLAKVGPQHAVKHQSAAEKKAEKLSETATKATPTPKGEPVKLGGDSAIAHIPAEVKSTITSDFKGMPNGKYLQDPTEDIFGNLVNLAAAHGKTVPGGLSVDQVLKTIDETHSKNLGVANSGMLHKKVTDWLGTAQGKAYAESHSVPDPKVVKQITGEVTLPEGVTLEPGQKVQPLAGPGAHDKGLTSSAFKGHTAAEAQAEQDAYKKAQGIVWTADQKKAMKAYTGNGSDAYTGINNYLRGAGGYDQVVKQYAVDIQSAMMPLREHTLLKRGTGYNGLPFDASNALDMVGKTFEDKGFTSSSVAGSGGHFSGQPLQLVIEAPKGTPAVFVNGISHYKDSENEMLLAAGTKFKILSAEKTSGGHVLMRVRIVGDK